MKLAASARGFSCSPAASRAGPARDSLDAIARDYVQLQLEIGEKEEGYIDAYYGPPEWQAEAKTDAATRWPSSPRAPRSSPSGCAASPTRRLEPIERRRRDFLLAQLKAASTRLRMMQGEKLAFADEAEGLFGVRPELKPLSRLRSGARPDRAAGARHGPALPSGSRPSRSASPSRADRLEPVMRAAIAECRRRTARAYRAARRTSASRSNSSPARAGAATIGTRAMPTASSRSTPTCRSGSAAPSISAATKAIPATMSTTRCSSRSWRKARGWVEFTVYPLYSPQCFIAEGSANYGIELAFPGRRAGSRFETRGPLSAGRPADRGRRRAILALQDAMQGAGRRPLHHRRRLSRRPHRPRAGRSS